MHGFFHPRPPLPRQRLMTRRPVTATYMKGLNFNQALPYYSPWITFFFSSSYFQLFLHFRVPRFQL
ncbi:hypothetical protein BDW42DRAFT_176706 [Aspergillus taichungensis]|uniref:Uncharacterized protein n=1 Tax=Aspergillus taichungensis TaxID=482145 RepID=A0A2J5HKC4_9EURO|nr:hypothetical protein BDW42DRAFT_176706 [Aspergillus taichungensis]